MYIYVSNASTKMFLSETNMFCEKCCKTKTAFKIFYFSFLDYESVHNHNRLSVGYDLLESATTTIKRTRKIHTTTNASADMWCVARFGTICTI